ncbi:MAG: hypothetical protein PUQ00_24725 [Nostoc sp. S13]|nr:hypothetical protein [Nostoc sp. S13]
MAEPICVGAARTSLRDAPRSLLPIRPWRPVGKGTASSGHRHIHCC